MKKKLPAGETVQKIFSGKGKLVSEHKNVLGETMHVKAIVPKTKTIKALSQAKVLKWKKSEKCKR